MKMEGKGMGGSGFEHVVGVEGCGHDGSWDVWK